MKYRSTTIPKRRLLSTYVALACAPMTLLAVSHAAHAQEAIFADDFSADSLSWTTRSFDDSGPASARGELGAIVMEASATDSGRSNRVLYLSDATDALSVTATIDTATDLGGLPDARVEVSLRSPLFNTVADGGARNANGDVYGDVQIDVTISARGDGTTGGFACLGRDGEDGFESYPLADDGNPCFDIPDGIVAAGTPVDFGFALDRGNGQLTLSINELEVETTLAGTLYESAFTQSEINVIAADFAPLAVARIGAISTDTIAADFTGTTPIVDRYRPNGFDPFNPGSAGVVDGRARLVGRSTELGSENPRLEPNQATDYLEATVVLSSESMLENDRMDARLESEWFNDTADGGFDGRTGDVRAIVELRADATGRRSAEYCLFRSDDANFDDRTGLLEGGSRCADFPTRLEFDTPYRIALELDREAATVRFRLDGFDIVQSLVTGAFEGSDPRAGLFTSTPENGTSVVFVDDLRTRPEALTDEELVSGLTQPASFPEPVDPATLAADSTLSAPYDFEQTLGFIDDFEDPASIELGFWSGARDQRGEAGVQFVDGAIELQVNSEGGDSDDGNFTEFYVNGATDLLRARVSLTSDTDLPPEPNAEAEVSLRAVFHNDLQNFGGGRREGDVSVRVRLRLSGGGGLSAAVSTDRRDANGNNEDYSIIDGDNYVEFGPTIALDTIYELALQIDRDRGVLIVSIDDVDLDIALPSQAFDAYQPEANIQLYQRGTSGRAVGRIHSIETDTIQRDFVDGPGLIGPYAPEFNSRSPGREITIADGRARFLTDATVSSGSDTRIWAAGGSDFVGATVELSSESVVQVDGAVQIGVAATLYNDFMAGRGAEGRVFAEMWLTAEGDGTRYAEYCAFRSNDDSFSDSTELINGMGEDCARFATPITLDTEYPMSLSLDRERSALVFTLGDETREYAIATQILEIERPFNAANLRASDGSIGVGFVDNFALNANPVPLAESTDVLVGAGDTTDGDGGVPVTGGGGDGDVTTGSSGNGGGGGCSIGGNSRGHTSLALLMLLAIGGLLRKRRRLV